MPPRLSIVVPFHNEASSLPTLYRELVVVLDRLDFETELIFIDDGSSDGGPAELIEVAGRDRRLRVLSVSPRSGQSAALEAGFRIARGELIATLDADLQNDPADLPLLLAQIDRADCVNGVRVHRRDRLEKRVVSLIANSVRRSVLGDHVKDIGCSLRLMRAESLRRIKLFRGTHRFLPVLLSLEGARCIDVDVNHRPRRFGSSKYAFGDRFVEAWIDLCAVFWMKRRTSRYDVKDLTPRR